MRDRVLGLLKIVNRPGMDKLTDWLVNMSDFMTAPASTKYHGCEEGGLLAHSLATYDQLTRALEWYGIECSAESAIICGCLHDVCKANFYKTSTRNAKDEKGNWIKVPFYEIEDRFPMGHGTKSLIIVREFIKLQVEEMMAIQWHGGAWDSTDYALRQSLSLALDRYPLVWALQAADTAAVYLDKK